MTIRDSDGLEAALREAAGLSDGIRLPPSVPNVLPKDLSERLRRSSETHGRTGSGAVREALVKLYEDAGDPVAAKLAARTIPLNARPEDYPALAGFLANDNA